MKKNVFVLFSSYFFVLQLIFIGFLRGDYRFFCLAGINTFFISIIGYFTRDRDSIQKSTLKIDENQIFSQKIHYSEKIHYIQKKPHNKNLVHHFWFFIISVLAGFFLWFWMPDMDLLLKIFLVTLLSFFVFIICGLLFRFRPFRVWESKLYFVVLALSLLGYVLGYFNIDVFDLNKPTNTNLSGDVFISGYDVNSFVPVDADLTGSETDSLNENTQTNSGMIELEETSDIDLTKKATFDDAIKHLLDKNSVTLLTDKAVKFTYISSNHADYPYYRTAYGLKMIGKSINPSKSLLCETYLVMQGLVENWNVPSYSDIKQAYWNYAKNNDKLPSCSYGKFLTLADIK